MAPDVPRVAGPITWTEVYRGKRRLSTVKLPEWRQVLLRDPCAYCGEPSEHVDHIHPRHAGGLDQVDNLTGACQHCNNSKGGKSLLAFLSGHDVGHEARRQSRHYTVQITEARQRYLERLSEERVEWVHREIRFKRAYQRKWGKPAPHYAIPDRLMPQP